MMIVTLFNSKGQQLPETFTVDYTGTVSVRLKEHWLRYARLFVNPSTNNIEINPINQNTQ